MSCKCHVNGRWIYTSHMDPSWVHLSPNECNRNILSVLAHLCVRWAKDPKGRWGDTQPMVFGCTEMGNSWCDGFTHINPRSHVVLFNQRVPISGKILGSWFSLKLWTDICFTTGLRTTSMFMDFGKWTLHFTLKVTTDRKMFLQVWLWRVSGRIKKNLPQCWGMTLATDIEKGRVVELFSCVWEVLLQCQEPFSHYVLQPSTGQPHHIWKYCTFASILHRPLKVTS